jgi:hypothetical protein
VVFCDPRREFAPFIAELRGGGDPGSGVATATAGGADAGEPSTGGRSSSCGP